MFTVYPFHKLGSTNDTAKRYKVNSVVIADEQTKGRGRFRRKWSSGKGGIWMSIVVQPISEVPQQLTFLAAIAVQRAISKIADIKSSIKWPNDLLVARKKVCGILTENIYRGKHHKMIVGIGVNVNNTIPRELSNKAISLHHVSNKKINIKKLVNRILFEFEKLYKIYNSKGFSPILKGWKALSGTLGKQVKVVTRTKTYYGKAISVDEQCQLLLRLPNKKTQKIIEGDLFVVG